MLGTCRFILPLQNHLRPLKAGECPGALLQAAAFDPKADNFHLTRTFILAAGTSCRTSSQRSTESRRVLQSAARFLTSVGSGDLRRRVLPTIMVDR